jgi:uncharacterized MAPEG superfamily protein
MTVPFWCVAVAFLLIMAPKIPLSLAMARAPGGYDNKNPREQQQKLEGWGKRSAAAHANAFEAFAPFAAAVIVAHLAHADAKWSSIMAITFVVSRVVYNVMYIANLAWARSTVWTVGYLCTIGLFLLGAITP